MTLRPQCSYAFEYDDSLQNLKAISLSSYVAVGSSLSLLTPWLCPTCPVSQDVTCNSLCHENPDLGS